MQLKVCGNKTIEGVNALVELDVDYIGFIFYPPSPRAISIEDYQSLMQFVKHKAVAVMVNPSLQDACEIIDKGQFNFIQLHGNESPELCMALRKKCKVIKALNGLLPDLEQKIKTYHNCTDYFLFDAVLNNSGGTGLSINSQRISQMQIPLPFFIAGGIDGDALALHHSVLHHPNFLGFDINSKFELSPGIKDSSKVKHFQQKIKFYETK